MSGKMLAKASLGKTTYAIHEHNVFDILALVRTEGDGRVTTVPFPKDLIRGYAAALAGQALSELLRKKP